MKLLAAIVLGGVMTAASWADTVKITIVREIAGGTPSTSTSASYVVKAGQSGVFDSMRTLKFSPTEGDCSSVDASKLEGEAKYGEVLRVSTSKSVDGHVFITLEYEYRKFLGTTAHQYSQFCKVNNPSSEGVSFDQTSSLRKDEPPLLLRATPEFKVFGVIEP